jgi:biopolymer transport protein ExbD
MPRTRQRSPIELKMTPMIDVVFLLLIFFVCTASFQALEQVLPTSVSLPAAGSESEPIDPELADLEEVVVRVSLEAGRAAWQVNERVVGDLASLRALLAQLVGIRSDLPVIVDVDGPVPMGDVIDVYDLCRLVGFDRVQFAAQAGGGA